MSEVAALPIDGRRQCILVRSVFLRLLGCIYLAAFWSMGWQIQGLIGSHGILPLQPFLRDVSASLGPRSKELLPTIFWFSSSDQALHLACVGGEILSLVLIVGALPPLVLALLWAIYLSLTIAGQTFLGFQWDGLLLEAGLLAIFLAPMELALWNRPSRPPSYLVILLLRWLIFRVMFLSGVVKLTSGDINWRHFAALRYHYESQPLPSWTSWYFHHLSPGFQSFSVGVTFAVELIVPLFVFGPRRMRGISLCAIVLFQILIAASGNFGFFNLLTIVLCVPILDDGFFPARWREKFRSRLPTPSRFWPKPILIPLTILIVIISGMSFAECFSDSIQWPASLVLLNQAVEPFRSINGYGLFRVMTTERPEIVVEGSDDEKTWRPYEFKWKPGDLHRAPAFCTPNMPRLDWQMWFAAPGDVRDNPWFINFMIRLLQGSPPVLELMGNNPFPDHPPTYVRAMLYKYEFTTAAERQANGNWWKRTLVGVYCPAISLRKFE